MRTTETPSCAAAAATERPPEPPPMTHRSGRSSLALTLSVDRARAGISAEPASRRTLCAICSLGLCMARLPFLESNRNKRRKAQEHQRQHDFLGEKCPGVDRQLTGVSRIAGQAARVIGFGRGNDAVEARAGGGKRQAARNDAEEGGDHVGA